MQLPDTDHSIAFWTQMALDFGNNPGVIFELFNEPYPQGQNTQAGAFSLLLNGGPQTIMSYNSGNSKITYAWNSAGYQQLLNVVRGNNAINFCLQGGARACVDLTGFTSAGNVSGGPYFMTDPLNNSGAAWHSYGIESSGALTENATFSANINPTTAASQCLAAGIPVVITECGSGVNTPVVNDGGANYAPTWADANGGQGHALIWTYDNWPSAITGNNPPAINGAWPATFMNWLKNHP